MSAAADHASTVLRGYLLRSLGRADHGCWDVRHSAVSGRGLFATRDLQPGDLVFHDVPVVWGPRTNGRWPMCAACHRVGRVTACPQVCGLPVCSPECAASPRHSPECSLLRQTVDLCPGEWRMDLLTVVAPLRCLFLSPEDREVVQCLQANQGSMEDKEVNLVKKYMKDKLGQEEEDWVRQCCQAMNTNAFEFLKVVSEGSETSLRGLYPVAAIMNHDCSPSTYHVYDSEGVMRVMAARPVAAGEELTNSYLSLLWTTPARRLTLLTTKHFLCCCPRCSDPSEFGSGLSSLPCECGGARLPVSPLLGRSPWLCGSCGSEVSAKQAIKLQSSLEAAAQRLTDPASVAQFLRQPGLGCLCGAVVHLKLNLIWQLGHDGFTWADLSQDMLDLKEKCCHDILRLLETLRLGQCRLKGLILLELHGALCEQIRRVKQNGHERQGIEEESKQVLTTAKEILHYDAAAQKKLNLRIQDEQSLISLA